MSIDEPHDREVFILGAGFSHGLNPAAPLTVGFLKDHADLLAKSRYRPAEEFIRRCGMEPSTLNIETLLTLAAVPKPWQPAYDLARDTLAMESVLPQLEVEFCLTGVSITTDEGEFHERIEQRLKSGIERRLVAT